MPGELIIVNRDDDDEDLERGPVDREEDEVEGEEKTMEEMRREKNDDDDDEEGISREKSNSSGSSTAAGSRGERSTKGVEARHKEKMEAPDAGHTDAVKREAELDEEGERREAAESDEERELEKDGRKPPPLRKFREGQHLVIEREVDDGGEVGPFSSF